MSSLRFGDLTTPTGYRMDELASWLQKSVRRGLVDDALFAASELDLAGYGAYAFKRLSIAAVEDIGMADPFAAVLVDTLRRNWLELRKNKADHSHADRLLLVQAVRHLCAAPKDRATDHATIVTYEGDRSDRPVPAWAKDVHTRAGRAAGADVEHFFEVGAVLANRAPTADAYEARARALRTATGATKPVNAHQAPLDLEDRPERPTAR